MSPCPTCASTQVRPTCSSLDLSSALCCWNISPMTKLIAAHSRNPFQLTYGKLPTYRKIFSKACEIIITLSHVSIYAWKRRCRAALLMSGRWSLSSRAQARQTSTMHIPPRELTAELFKGGIFVAYSHIITGLYNTSSHRTNE